MSDEKAYRKPEPAACPGFARLRSQKDAPAPLATAGGTTSKELPSDAARVYAVTSGNQQYALQPVAIYQRLGFGPDGMSIEGSTDGVDVDGPFPATTSFNLVVVVACDPAADGPCRLVSRLWAGRS